MPQSERQRKVTAVAYPAGRTHLKMPGEIFGKRPSSFQRRMSCHGPLGKRRQAAALQDAGARGVGSLDCGTACIAVYGGANFRYWEADLAQVVEDQGDFLCPYFLGLDRRCPTPQGMMKAKKIVDYQILRFSDYQIGMAAVIRGCTPKARPCRPGLLRRRNCAGVIPDGHRPGGTNAFARLFVGVSHVPRRYKGAGAATGILRKQIRFNALQKSGVG